MIQSFADRRTQKFFENGDWPKQWEAFQGVAARKLDMIDAAEKLSDLRVSPNNRLEKLKGKREGQHSIRINDQWRVYFVWTANGPADVGIIDYHKG